jgi:hypothetical protein
MNDYTAYTMWARLAFLGCCTVIIIITWYLYPLRKQGGPKSTREGLVALFVMLVLAFSMYATYQAFEHYQNYRNNIHSPKVTLMKKVVMESYGYRLVDNSGAFLIEQAVCLFWGLVVLKWTSVEGGTFKTIREGIDRFEDMVHIKIKALQVHTKTRSRL